ncbi:MAG TPA: DUF5652 family protein [Candidatus Nanoarchaeia archaeon]|nr:DUF5652 family protein [Candidatus Nanoarchaeia archaeon]
MVDPTFANLSASIFALLIILGIWELIWKAIALWKAARNNHKVWYVIILIINTIGILPILYIYVFSKKKKKSK